MSAANTTRKRPFEVIHDGIASLGRFWERTVEARPMLRNKVPAVTASFWFAKLLTTGMGETSSDFLVRRFDPVVAVGVIAALFVVVLAAQIAARRYVPWLYWSAVVLVGVLGTMVADAAHVIVGVPYTVSVGALGLLLAATFTVWRLVEGTVDVHAIDTRRREGFYWTTVVLTFALGTAAGDLTASTFHLGYLLAGIVFVGVMAIAVALYCIRVLGRRVLGAVAAFWTVYVLTRPVGASFADWAAHAHGGLGLGTGLISAGLFVLIVVTVGTMSVDDVARRRRERGHARTREAAPPVHSSSAPTS